MAFALIRVIVPMLAESTFLEVAQMMQIISNVATFHHAIPAIHFALGLRMDAVVEAGSQVSDFCHQFHRLRKLSTY
jgi:hypothetical protein